MKPNIESLSCVFLCYNEAENVSRCVTEMRTTLERLAIPAWEIIVVDDGSSDGTRERALGLADPRVRVVRHDRNLGYGEALLTGIRSARLSWTFMTDGDLQFFPEDLASLLEPVSPRHGLVQGYRVARQDPRPRLLLGRAYQVLIRLLFRLPVRDVECAFRLFNTSAAQSLKPRCAGDLVAVELVQLIHKAGFAISEVGVRHRPREHGKSKVVTWKALRRLTVELVRLLARATG